MAKVRPLGVIPLGDSAAYVEFSATLDLEINGVVQRLALAVLRRKVPWIRDVVPALGGIALHFDPDNAEFPADPMMASIEMVTECLKEALAAKEEPGREVEL
ncbi:MAG TPA: carboxyltransferase domain-containing protein, partial [Burkholderiales bacterium]|nr:carboxyltransferase domain-containing protein [Burkholderiales bacterium]